MLAEIRSTIKDKDKAFYVKVRWNDGHTLIFECVELLFNYNMLLQLILPDMTNRDFSLKDISWFAWRSKSSQYYEGVTTISIPPQEKELKVEQSKGE